MLLTNMVWVPLLHSGSYCTMPPIVIAHMSHSWVELLISSLPSDTKKVSPKGRRFQLTCDLNPLGPVSEMHGCL